ncbi:MAG: alpha-hydroxy-acid oxidizing protein [Alphaproteobacteria bacterium]|nr:alpha-hydroxy-acid oxidizing protein [Alphaproteobacteria bacterium]MBL6672730.1 alpha-hydroxy-acid oxidizing protein [Alphaproteobacteria bacterium]
MTAITCVDDLRDIARKRTPRMFFDYCESGSWSESTLHANEADLQAIKFRQRVAIDVDERSTSAKMLGDDVTMPVALAPTGLTGMQHADGEILAAQAAEEFGVPFTLSTMSICSIEDVAENTTKPFWFQLYVMRDRKFVHRLIERARVAGCSALVITVDLQIMGQRHRDVKNGLSAPPKPTLANLVNLATKPGWCLKMLGTRRRYFGNVVGHVDGIEDMSSLAQWTAGQFDPTLSWDDVRELRRLWDGKVIIKGVMDAEDAAKAIDVGADAIIVSNHGGRQLDGAPSSIAALPQIVDMVGGRCEVWMDGGIRSGQDVLRALALGADGTMIGRAFLYGLAAGGKTGVQQVLQIIQKELDLTMAFCGRRTLGEVDRDILLPKSG